jgi:hypothetical protein
MTSEYEPIFSRRDARDERDLDAVRRLFAIAARPFLHWPWGWFAWALLLPAAALATPAAAARFGAAGTLYLWSGAILIAGTIEVVGVSRSRTARVDQDAPSGLGRWAMRTQGNLSLIAVALSVLLLATGTAWALPALWLLLLGHSLWALGTLAFPVWRRCGLLYQTAGCVALVPGWGLIVLAIATALGNAWIGWTIARARPRSGLGSRAPVGEPLDARAAQPISQAPPGH